MYKNACCNNNGVQVGKFHTMNFPSLVTSLWCHLDHSNQHTKFVGRTLSGRAGVKWLEVLMFQFLNTTNIHTHCNLCGHFPEAGNNEVLNPQYLQLFTDIHATRDQTFCCGSVKSQKWSLRSKRAVTLLASNGTERQPANLDSCYLTILQLKLI